MTTKILTPTPNSQITTTRTIPAPITLVYQAWTNPNHLKNWWGPAGFTNTFHEFDFRVGGKWRFTMHGPDKGNYENECEFIKIEVLSLIAWQRISRPIFQVVATFEKVSDNETKVVFKMLFETEEECGKIKKFVVDKNEENFDRLEEELSKML